MNERRVTPEDDLRVALAPDDTIPPLDPARVIAGARRRRKVRALAAAGAASVAVIGVAAGGFLAAGGYLDNAPQPADPGVIDPTVESTPRTPGSTATPGPSATPGLGATPAPGASVAPPSGKATVAPETAGETVAPLTVANCLAAAAGQPGPRPAAASEQGKVTGTNGQTMVVADAEYWLACDNTYGGAVSVRRPARFTVPSVQDTDAFAVANDRIDTPAGAREYYWAVGQRPDEVAKVRYTFPDGESVDAEVNAGFWIMRHVATKPVLASTAGTRIRVRLLSATGAVLNDFRLTWGDQTCAQISHGC